MPIWLFISFSIVITAIVGGNELSCYLNVVLSQ